MRIAIYKNYFQRQPKKKKKKLISVEFRRISNKLLIMYRTYSINIRVCLEITRAREIFNFDPLT